MKPDLNYLETLIRGATEIGLEQEYIDYLKLWPAIPFHKFDFGEIKWPTNPIRLFKMTEVLESKNEEVPTRYMVLKGLVFGIGKDVPKSWASLFVGSDVTLSFFGKRWAWADDDNTKDSKQFQEKQKLYIYDQLWILSHGYWYFGKLVGKLHPEEVNSFESYGW